MDAKNGGTLGKKSNTISKGNHFNILLASFHEEIFQIEESLLWCVHVHKGGRNSSFAATSCSSNLMDIIFDFLRHRKDDDMLNIIEIETFRSNARCNHHVF